MGFDLLSLLKLIISHALQISRGYGVLEPDHTGQSIATQT